jgi:enediyne biosynthesis protein E4
VRGAVFAAGRHAVARRLGAALVILWASPDRLTAEPPSFPPIVFELMEETGVDFAVEPSRTDRHHQPETMISGVALLDYDNDGRLDIYAVSGATMPGLQKTLPSHQNRLYRNLGGFRFEDVTERAFVGGRGYTHGVAVADYDNDGDQDLFVAGLRENILYRNKADGTFEDATKSAGLGAPDPKYGTLWSVAAAFFDYDRDGWLDLFVSNYCVWDPVTEPVCGPYGKSDYCHPQHYEGLPNSLYRNQRDGTFVDVSVETGIRKHIGKGMGIGPADFDEDGFIDLYVANDTVPAFLFRNVEGKRFDEIAFESGCAYTYYGSAVSGMGVDAKDLNNDGKVDVFVSAMSNEAFPFYMNVGDNLFEEMTAPSNLAILTREKAGWSAGIFDLNNDGWKDIFVASADVMDPRGFVGSQVPHRNTVFANLGNGRFADASPTAGARFNEAIRVHRGAAFGDIDDDGRIDAVVTSLSGPTEIWRNVSPGPFHWLRIATLGRRGNRDGMGAKIRVTTASGSQHNHVNTAVGYGCASDKRVHFGLGRNSPVKEIVVTWLSGEVQTLTDVAADQTITVTEPGP